MPADELPSRLFSWQVATPDPQRGACGVAFEQNRAVHDLAEAMLETGGTCGIIQSCRVSRLGPFYVYGSVVGHIEVDEASGGLVVREHRRVSARLDEIAVRRGWAVAPCPSNPSLGMSSHVPDARDAVGSAFPTLDRLTAGSR